MTMEVFPLGRFKPVMRVAESGRYNIINPLKLILVVNSIKN